MITSYTFGKIIIGARTFTSDLIIFPDKTIQGHWRRASGHTLTLDDLSPVLDKNPDLIIAGTGAHGKMGLAPDLKPALKNLGIEIKALPTNEAAQLYNELEAPASARRITACFHLTC